MASRLGEYVRTLRHTGELTTRELAHAAECSQSFIVLIEKGERFPNLKRLWEMVDALDGEYAYALYLLCVDSGVPEEVAREATGQ